MKCILIDPEVYFAQGPVELISHCSETHPQNALCLNMTIKANPEGKQG